jgi:hypothetical protein
MLLKDRGFFDLLIIQGLNFSLLEAFIVRAIIIWSLDFFLSDPFSVARVLFGDIF